MIKHGPTDRQQSIVNWFDDVYRSKGDRYLRPVHAYFVFLELLQARPEERLLDVACGLGRLLEAAREYGVSMCGIDISEVAVQKAAQSVPEADIQSGNAEQLPFADQTFDLVTCIGSLERMLDAEAALSEMARVGRKDARYCIMVRNSASFGWRLRSLISPESDTGNAGADTLRGWSQLFESNGFRIRSVHPDQYPIHIKKQWISMGLKKPDFRQPVPGSKPLKRSNEFIFLLSRQA